MTVDSPADDIPEGPETPSGIQIPDSINSLSLNPSSDELYRRHPYLLPYREWLGELTSDRILGEGGNAIVITHPEYPDKAVKISKGLPKSDDLAKELRVHAEIYRVFQEGKRMGLVPENVFIPFLLPAATPTGNKPVIVMDKIPGQSFSIVRTLKFLDENRGKKNEYKIFSDERYPTAEEIAFMKTLTDYQVEHYLLENYGSLDFFQYQSTEDKTIKRKVRLGFSVRSKGWAGVKGKFAYLSYLSVLEHLGAKSITGFMKTVKENGELNTDLAKAYAYLYRKGFHLLDIHGGNFKHGASESQWFIDLSRIDFSHYKDIRYGDLRPK